MNFVREKLLLKKRGVVSIVGAGGKTTLMYRLARELSEAGERVLTTTTTKIFKPTKDQTANLIVSSQVGDVIQQAEECLAVHPHVTAAREELVPHGKLKGFDPIAIEQIWETGLFQWVLVEADGAAGRPLKAPAEHEPVVPSCSSLVVGVVGLDVVGKALNERNVFRAELFSRISDLPLCSAVTEASIARIIEHKDGLFKGCPRSKRFVLLNKAETELTRRAARKIGSLVLKNNATGIEKIIIGAIGNEFPAIEWSIR